MLGFSSIRGRGFPFPGEDVRVSGEDVQVLPVPLSEGEL